MPRRQARRRGQKVNMQLARQPSSRRPGHSARDWRSGGSLVRCGGNHRVHDWLRDARILEGDECVRGNIKIRGTRLYRRNNRAFGKTRIHHLNDIVIRE